MIKERSPSQPNKVGLSLPSRISKVKVELPDAGGSHQRFDQDSCGLVELAAEQPLYAHPPIHLSLSASEGYVGYPDDDGIEAAKSVSAKRGNGFSSSTMSGLVSLSKRILAGDFVSGDHVVVDAGEDQLTFEKTGEKTATAVGATTVE